MRAVVPLAAIVPMAFATLAAAPTGPPTPSVTVPAAAVRVGDRILVGLTNWPVGTVQLEVCGNQARRGALDCAVAGAAHIYVPPSGVATAQFTLTTPPVACPCVVRARALTGSASATVPVSLSGVVPSPVVGPVAPAELRITDLRVADAFEPGQRSGLLGLPTQLTIRVSVRSDAATDVRLKLSLLVGRPDRVATIVAAPDLGTLGAGQTRTYLLRVPLDAPAIGRYAVHGRIEAGGDPVGFEVEAAIHPWGLLAVLGALLTLPVLRRRRRPGRRRTTGSTT